MNIFVFSNLVPDIALVSQSHLLNALINLRSSNSFHFNVKLFAPSVFVEMGRSSSTLYVGNLPGDIREREVEDLFYKYGHIVHVDLKMPPRPPGYAFVEFEEVRDAEDAIRGRDGYDFDGHRLRVELAHGGRGHPSSTDRYSNHSGSRGPRGGVSKRSEYRVVVTGLPQSASWQDLKDHMRKAGDVCFSQVFHEGSGKKGMVDYTNYDDMKYAIKKLDDSEFRNAFSRARIHVKEYDSSDSRSRSRSRSRTRSRSPSYSKGRSNVRSRSRSPTGRRSRSRSNSPRGKVARRSRSRSKSVSSPPLSRSKAHSASRSPARSGSPKPSEQKRVSKSPKGLQRRGSSRGRSQSKSPSQSRSRSLSR